MQLINFAVLTKLDSTLFLQFVLVLVTFGVIIDLVWFPQKVRRAASLDPFSTYSNPFIIYGYIATIPIFIALYQVFKLLNISIANQVFSRSVDNIAAFSTVAAAVFQRLCRNAVTIKSENDLTVQQAHLWE